MKTVATINFKGGVCKTTVTWALANVIAQNPNKHSLMFDLDAQMSPQRFQPSRSSRG